MPASESKPPLRTLFDSLTSLESREARDEFLDFTCRDHPELRARLERLLALRYKVDDYFDIGKSAPAADEPSEDDSTEGTGTRIGRYRLLGRLGEGGYGVVYLAEQQEPVKRRVALKIIRLGMDTENVIARFEMERQALAMMDHPNIARVLDVGATKTGRPYFVMQLVDGEKITAYCDEKRLGIPERLKLFVRICHAVQHAHQKGVIHRDIKPSNILVWVHDGEAVPKVIDFGIAKATAAGLDEQVTFTVDGQFIGTPAYMSPEQATGAGMDVDTRSDIYSLGALLYELLSGRPPFDPAELRKSGVEEIRAMLRDVEPCRPSVAVENSDPGNLMEIAGRRSCEPQKLAGQIRGDLDRIVMKAMAKDRQHRYSSADVLAADLLCYLNHEPISARPPGGLYRLGKLVRRNKVVFAAGTLVVLSLVLGLGAATAMFLRANQAREAAELARANEAALRRKAEIGQQISHAAVLLKYGKIAEADALIADINPSDARPSLESAQTFRELGLWHAREDRWDKAAARFAALAYSLASADKTDTEAISGDLQPAASALCEAGDFKGYEKLRNMVAERFGETSKAIVAEQAVKPCLLTPASDEFLAKLVRLEEKMLATHASTSANNRHERNVAAWREFAIGLMEYRKGNLNDSLDWLEKCLAETNQNRARDAAVRALRAMIYHRQNRAVEAEDELAAARFLVTERFATEPGIFDQGEPWWQDWVNARILLREADRVMGE
jgi:serine/threonine protein kinase/tetratricopeptide (TPR) repeat protein